MSSMAGSSSAEAPKRAQLHVENLSPLVTESMLTEIFAVTGPIQDVNIITPDPRIDENGGLINNYGFVEYMDMSAAEAAVHVLNGRKIFDTEIRVNRAYQQNKEDTSSRFRVFVGDLGSEVDDNVLGSLFSGFGISEASVMWDMNGKSRGYGFVAFPHKTDAEHAIAIMNGHQLGSRAISVTWANQRTKGGPSESTGSPMRGGGTAPAPQAVSFLGPSSPLTPLSYETVVRQAPAYNTTVCVGNLVPDCTQTDLISLFQSIGNFSPEIRMQVDCGFASVKVESHEHAAMAIVELHGHMVHGRPIMCSWGKERPDTGTLPTGPLSPTQSAAAPHTYTPSAYGQYGFNAYPQGQ